MSVTHNLTFAWGAGTPSATVTATGNVAGDVSAAVAAGGANDVEHAWVNANLQSIYAVSDVAVTLTTNGARQAETATVVGNISGNGNASVTVTSGILSGSPVTYSVPVTTSLTTASLVAGAVRAYLQTQTALTALYAVGGTGATVSLTALLPAANDSTLNIAIDNGTCTGLTTAGTSSNTTAGVAVQDTFTLAANSPLVWYAGGGITNPFAGNVTKLTVTNYGASAGTLTLKSLATT